MELFYAFGLIAGLSHLGVSGRAVNISSAWFLPQEGYPVFYRYFSDKVTWNEAEAVCNFHHADLLSVETSGQMDAARAYLKEIDVTDNVWIGLKKESPEKPFSWTNGEKLLGDGYWTEPIPKTNEKLCAAIDPVADFRWNSFYCRGPQLASFVCELPVPDWAKKENGCLITSLPSLTITLMPEVGVIQLLSDCGLDGTRRIACNAGVDREEIVKRLSCDVDAFASTIFSRSTTAGTVKEINTQQSPWSEAGNRMSRYQTTKAFSAHTRHRRNADSTRANAPLPAATSSPPRSEKTTSAPLSRDPLRPTRLGDARTTAKPPTNRIKPRKSAERNPDRANPRPPSSTSPPSGSPPAYEDLPVLIITGEKLNKSASSGTSENAAIVLMMENKNREEPFLVPLSDDVLVDPSLSPVELINVDLIEVDNLTANATGNQTTPVPPAAARPPRVSDSSATTEKPETEDATDDSLNVLDDKGVDGPQKPNRGRLLTHSGHPSFYPRFLNRVLG